MLCFVTVILGACVALPIVNGAAPGAIITVSIVAFLTFTFILDVFLGTTYRVSEDGKIDILCGRFFKSTLDIMTIRSIKRTNSPLAAPAPSLDRVELRLGKFDTVMVSPKDQLGFINELVKINPLIENCL